jgi:hypothetical protein
MVISMHERVGVGRGHRGPEAPLRARRALGRLVAGKLAILRGLRAEAVWRLGRVLGISIWRNGLRRLVKLLGRRALGVLIWSRGLRRVEGL